MLCGQAPDAQSPKKQHQQIVIFIISLTNLSKTLQRVINEYILDLIEIWRPRNNKACIQTFVIFSVYVVCLIIIKERKYFKIK